MRKPRMNHRYRHKDSRILVRGMTKRSLEPRWGHREKTAAPKVFGVRLPKTQRQAETGASARRVAKNFVCWEGAQVNLLP